MHVCIIQHCMQCVHYKTCCMQYVNYKTYFMQCVYYKTYCILYAVQCAYIKKWLFPFHISRGPLCDIDWYNLMSASFLLTRDARVVGGWMLQRMPRRLRPHLTIPLFLSGMGYLEMNGFIASEVHLFLKIANPCFFHNHVIDGVAINTCSVLIRTMCLYNNYNAPDQYVIQLV